MRHIFEIGWRSTPLIATSGLAIGVVLSMHTRASLERFGAEAMIPAGLAIALIRETGPLVTALLVAGRVGAGIGAELGAMKVTEQIDALEAVAVDSFKYLAVTRILACILAMPLLTTITDFCGIFGGFLAEFTISGMSWDLYFNRAFSLIQFSDFIPATFKTAVFGMIIGTIGCYLGFTTTQGTEGVGRTATRSVVLVFDPDHRDQRGAGPADLLPLPGQRVMDEPAIRLDGVTKAFNGRKVLDNVTLEIAEGIGFCLLGRSGTGKSVTLKHIIGLLKPDKGHVYVHGKDVPSLPARELAGVRKTMGFLFQSAALFDSITVGENVAFPLRRHTDWPDEKIRSVAKAKLADVGLDKDYDKMPGDLSGGMRKRAGLARAMALDPDILLADEPSAGLDPITADEIDELLVDLKKKGTTLVMVTHNIPSARHVADELAMLHEGRVIARGTVEELDRSDNELVRAFMRSDNAG